MSAGNVLGVRLERSGLVHWVDGDGVQAAPGDTVVVELSKPDAGHRQEATVTVGSGQMIRASVGRLSGRVLRRVDA